ncbi:MAG: hypothetical protein ACT4N2_09890 [Hyphomicrobium sp.]
MRQRSATSSVRLATALLLVSAVSAAAPFHQAAAGAPEPKALSEDCFAELETGSGPEIACAFPLRLDDRERADLKRVTREYVHDITCRMTVRIARAKVDEAIRASDLVFQSPEQPVTCTITTPKSAFDVTATFAPRVVFKGDKAVEATPGLGNVKGVTRVLSWPVMLYVNRGPGMRSGMLQIVNAYRDHARRKTSASR